MQISVIIRTYNEEKYLDELLTAIDAQVTNDGVEVVVVDSGSTDSTLDIAHAQGARIVHVDALADAKCEGKVVTFELDSEDAAVAPTNIEAAGLSDRVVLYEGHSSRLLPEAISSESEIRCTNGWELNLA